MLGKLTSGKVSEHPLRIATVKMPAATSLKAEFQSATINFPTSLGCAV
jgi:hypothetical protein